MKRIAPALLTLVIIGPASAQSNQRESGPLALTLPASARIVAMGGVGVAGRDDDVVFYNPAQLTVARGTSFSLARMSASARGGTMSTVLRLGSGGLAFGVNYLEYQAPIAYPLELGDVIGPNFTTGTSALGVVGYARTYHGFRVGAAAKYAVDAVSLERFSGAYADVGLARDFGRYSTALSIQNLGATIKRGSQSIEAPAMATLGVATSRPVGPLDVVATAALSASRESELTGGAGAEVGWSWISGYSIAGRAGVHQARDPDDAVLSGGFGFIADRIAIDLAAELLTGDRVSYRAGVRVR